MNYFKRRCQNNDNNNKDKNKTIFSFVVLLTSSYVLNEHKG